MKLFSSLLSLGMFALVASSQGQGIANQPPTGGGSSATQDVVDSMGGIRRPTPTPGTTSTAKPTGPMEIGLFKDAKGKSGATTFSNADTVYLVATNVSGQKGDKLSVTWFGEAGKSGKAKKLTSSESSLPNTGVFNPSYNLPPAKGGSPTGPYYVEFAVNGKVLKKLSFTVK